MNAMKLYDTFTLWPLNTYYKVLINSTLGGGGGGGGEYAAYSCIFAKFFNYSPWLWNNEFSPFSWH